MHYCCYIFTINFFISIKSTILIKQIQFKIMSKWNCYSYSSTDDSSVSKCDSTVYVSASLNRSLNMDRALTVGASMNVC